MWGSVKRSVGKALSGNGILFIFGLTAIQAIGLIGVSSIILSYLPGSTQKLTVLGINVLSLNLFSSAIVGSLISLASIILYIFLLLSALRSFLGKKKLLRHLFLPSLNLVIGGIIASIAVAFGFALLILPGIYLALVLYLWYPFVVDRNVSFIEGFKKSWEATKGIKMKLLGVTALASLASIAINISITIISTLVGFIGSSIITSLVNALGQNLTILVALAVPIEVYKQVEGSARSTERDGGSKSPKEKERSVRKPEGMEESISSQDRNKGREKIPTGATFKDQNRGKSPSLRPRKPSSQQEELSTPRPPEPQDKEDKPPKPPAKSDEPPRPPAGDNEPPVGDNTAPEKFEPNQDRRPPNPIENRDKPQKPSQEALEEGGKPRKEPPKDIDPAIKKKIYENLANQHEKIINLLDDIRGYLRDSKEEK